MHFWTESEVKKSAQKSLRELKKIVRVGMETVGADAIKDRILRCIQKNTD